MEATESASSGDTPPTNRLVLSDATITSISGSVSGFAATFAKQPIQRLKWIRQVDSGAIVPYNELLRRTIAEDGFVGLFRGSVAGIMRNVPHSALVFTIYPQMEQVVLTWQQRQQVATAPPQRQQQTGASGASSSGEAGPSQTAASAVDGSSEPAAKVEFMTRFWAGYATLFFATLITHPLDTLRVRLSVTHGEAASTPAMIKAVVDTGGLRALYQGFGATLVGAGPRGALGFGVFETLKDVSQKYDAAAQISPTTQKLLFGYVAGLCAETAIYPLDTVRRRQQALGDASPLGRLGQFNVFSALMHVARAEGLTGMFKGLSLNLVKNPIATAVSFTVNDMVKDMLQRRRAGGGAGFRS